MLRPHLTPSARIAQRPLSFPPSYRRRHVVRLPKDHPQLSHTGPPRMNNLHSFDT